MNCNRKVYGCPIYVCKTIVSERILRFLVILIRLLITPIFLQMCVLSFFVSCDFLIFEFLKSVVFLFIISVFPIFARCSQYQFCDERFCWKFVGSEKSEWMAFHCKSDILQLIILLILEGNNSCNDEKRCEDNEIWC